MALRFHNSLTGRVDEFVPQTEGKVLIYTCGPTVYAYPHIGNWAAYIYWDILVRILIANDYEVNRVINITDVGHLVSDADDGEDKLEKGAHRENKTAWDVAEFYTNDFLSGIKRLNMIMPEHIAKATDFISEQLELVRQLKQKGYTYQINDGIYYDTSKFPTYADFAHLNLDELQAGARVEYNTEKRNHSDFALWKFTPIGEKRDMEWDTPIDLLDNGVSLAVDNISIEGPLEPKSDPTPGLESDLERSRTFGSNMSKGDNSNGIKGFPGWHLECSAMAMSILGPTLDIHTGGIDHLPIHHTNEIAQSEAVSGVRFSNYWLHNNHLKVNGTKISKSLGNGYTLDDLEEKGFSMQDFRMFVLQGNYKNEGNFTFDNLKAAKNRLNNWRNVAAIRHQIHNTLDTNHEKIDNPKTILLFATSGAIIEAVDNDLNTPDALKIIDEAFARITSSHLDNIHRPSLIKLLETIDSVLGLQLIETTPDITEDVKHIIIERRSARDEKNWARSDELRDKLLGLGIATRDTNKEIIWEYIA